MGGNIHLNNKGDAVFNGVLDTDVNGYGTKDTGLFQWSAGHLSLIARTGTVLPGVGTVKNLVMGQIVVPPPPILVDWSDRHIFRSIVGSPPQAANRIGGSSRVHGMSGPGSFHLILTSRESYSRYFANVYFGTGDNVWRKKP